MKVCVIGTGYVGLVTGACLADLGHSVIGVDIDEQKINGLQNGHIPIYEPGLEEIVVRAANAGHLRFTTDLHEGIQGADAILFAVGTPPKEDGSADMQYVYSAAESVSEALNNEVVLISKSTVPVGTGEEIRRRVEAKYDGVFHVVSNPEFLREGTAVQDFMHPERIVVGVESERAEQVMRELYQAIDTEMVVTDVKSAEMIKYASNAFLATKISFINEIANVCEHVGATVDDVAHGMGLDSRIGPRFLRAGVGYGGSCFPKDVRALHQIAGIHGYPFQLLKAVIEVNNKQKWHFYDRIVDRLGTMRDKRIAVLGLAFKPNTDDIRESIGIEFARRFIADGVEVRAYDPIAMNMTREHAPDIPCVATVMDAVQDVDAVIVVTDWQEFEELDLTAVRDAMRQPMLFDGRNQFDAQKMRDLGYIYEGIGRPVAGVSSEGKV